MSTSENCNKLVSTAMHTALSARDQGSAEVFRRIYPEPHDQSLEGQIRAANDFWRMQLGQVCNAKSISAREALVDCDLDNWMRLFHSEVLPHVLSLGLPRG